jgi:CHASE1-domain containing sensor protein
VERRPVPLALSIFAGLLLVTAIAAVFSARQVDRRAEQALDDQAASAVRAVDRRIDTYTEKLYGIRGAFAGSERLTRAEYESYLASQEIEQRYPGVLAIGYGDKVPEAPADRAAYFASVRRDAGSSGLPYPPFTVRPNAERPDLVPVTYLHPVAANATAFGFDLLSEPARRTAVELARDRGRPTATAPLRLVTETGDQHGILIMLPRFRGDDQSPPFSRRKREFLGVAFVALRLPDLLRTALRPTDETDLEIYDVGAVGAVPSRLRSGDQAFNLRGGADALHADPEESRVLPLLTAGRQWRVYYSTKEELVPANERVVPWLILLLGLMVSSLAAAAVHYARTAERRAVDLADSMTEDLRESREELARSNEELERFARPPAAAAHGQRLPPAPRAAPRRRAAGPRQGVRRVRPARHEADVDAHRRPARLLARRAQRPSPRAGRPQPHLGRGGRAAARDHRRDRRGGHPRRSADGLGRPRPAHAGVRQPDRQRDQVPR